MSEKEVREAAKAWRAYVSLDDIYPGECERLDDRLLKALKSEPDLVVVLWKLRQLRYDERIDTHKGLLKRLSDSFEQRFHIRLTDEPPGWEYTDDQP